MKIHWRRRIHNVQRQDSFIIRAIAMVRSPPADPADDGDDGDAGDEGDDGDDDAMAMMAMRILIP
jgi:hypothetical protein